MEKYWEGVKNTEEIDRGLYIILPLRYQGDFRSVKMVRPKRKNKNLHDERSLPTECGGTSETF